jgi:hypothetical protein
MAMSTGQDIGPFLSHDKTEGILSNLYSLATALVTKKKSFVVLTT